MISLVTHTHTKKPNNRNNLIQLKMEFIIFTVFISLDALSPSFELKPRDKNIHVKPKKSNNKNNKSLKDFIRNKICALFSIHFKTQQTAIAVKINKIEIHGYFFSEKNARNSLITAIYEL